MSSGIDFRRSERIAILIDIFDDAEPLRELPELELATMGVPEPAATHTASRVIAYAEALEPNMRIAHLILKLRQVPAQPVFIYTGAADIFLNLKHSISAALV